VGFSPKEIPRPRGPNFLASPRILKGGSWFLMAPSYTISLFDQRPDQGPRPTSIAASFVLHTLAIAVVWFAVTYRPPYARVATDHLPVRELDLNIPDDMRTPPRIHAPAASAGAHSPASQGKPSPSDPALREVAQAQPGPQTLIQPDVEHPITLPEQIPVPQVAIWQPSAVPVKKIVPALPQKPAPSEVKPSVESPNQELTLADVKISSTFHPTPKPIVAASTTSPVTVHAPPQPPVPLSTTSLTAKPPTPAALLSMSNLRMKEGVAILPPVNESVVVKSPGTLTGQSKDAATPGKDNASTKPGQGGSSTGPAGNPNANSHNTTPGPGLAFKISGPGISAPNGKSDAPEPEADAGPADVDSNQLSTTAVNVTKDGRFSSIIVGNSLQDEYPEIGGVWNGRVVYTVYLHVGLARSWVLQYSLVRAPEETQTGPASAIEAPWPYTIVRPNLDPGSIDADALMIHGFVNQSGHFETLSMVFPQAFPQAQFVIAALEKWQFRAAVQGGQPARVEVLLIIPEQSE
jgi:hypothetical protein